MPSVAALFAIAAVAGGSAADASDAFVAAHVVLLIGGFAAFGLAAALAGVYLWQERRLRSHAADVLRAAPPPLLTLDVLAARTAAVGRCCSPQVSPSLARGHDVDLAVVGHSPRGSCTGGAYGTP